MSRGTNTANSANSAANAKKKTLELPPAAIPTPGADGALTGAFSGERTAGSADGV